MTTITSVSDLAQLPDGARFSAPYDEHGTTHIWEKRDGRFARSISDTPVTLEADAFEGAIQQGVLTVLDSVEPLTWIQVSGYYLLVMSFLDNDRVRLMQFYNEGRYVGPVTLGMDTVVAANKPTMPTEPWVDLAYSLVSRLIESDRRLDEQVRAHRSEMEHAATAAAESLQATETRLRNLTDTVAAWLEDNEEDLDHPLEDAIRSAGHEGRRPPQEQVSVTVRIEGVTETAMDYDDAERVVQGARICDVADNVEFTITWTAEYEVTHTVDEGDCACALIQRNQVERWLNENEVNWMRFSYETECENC